MFLSGISLPFIAGIWPHEASATFGAAMEPPLLHQSFFAINETSAPLGGGSNTSTPRIPRFEPDQGVSFHDYLRAYGGAIFHRWAERLSIAASTEARKELVYQETRDRTPGKKRILLQRDRPLPIAAVFQETENTMVPLGRPISREKRAEISRDLSALERRYWHSERDGANIWFRGTTPDSEPRNSKRKVYVNPQLETVASFVEDLYEIIHDRKIPILNSKIHLDNLQRAEPVHPDDDRGDILGQSHNTYCIYLTDDDAIPPLLKAISEVEARIAGSGPALLVQKADNYPKGIQALEGKAVLGLDLDDRWSFDQWTAQVVGVAYRAAETVLKGNPTASHDDIFRAVRAAMVQQIKRFRGEGADPGQFLSL